MKVFTGGQALSEFRRQRAERRLAAACPGSGRVLARYQYFVATQRDLTAAECAQLADLWAGEGGDAAGPVFSPGRTWVVIPRLGTQSPWSSKATEIAWQVGLGSVVRRIERGVQWWVEGASLADSALAELAAPTLDRMTETVVADTSMAAALFAEEAPRPLQRVALGADPLAALEQANQALGLALSALEMRYLVEVYADLGRDPTDAELMMFAQANSEHCRHKIFNADWTLDGKPQPLSLFAMIRHTHQCHPQGVLSAYCDNAAVMAGQRGFRWIPDLHTGEYQRVDLDLAIIMKVETHNHPTAIAPYPGAATGAGGEIRDEGATGRGSKPKAGLTGFSVSDLQIPGFAQPWEAAIDRPYRIESALNIMLEGPIGAAAFNNEFGRPALAGYFRSLTLEATDPATGQPRWFGYHKPIMLAGGVGSIRGDQVHKLPLPAQTPIVVLGGPALLIGLGGGAASSMASGHSDAALDFASVQRGNPEIQRRCQEVIDRCTALGVANPILSIHDVGAGGLSNAIPEILHDAGRGGQVDLRSIPSAEPGLSPLEIWCNEAQERYVLAIDPAQWSVFAAIAQRERAPYAVVGHASAATRLQVDDPLLGAAVVDLPMAALLGQVPRMQRTDQRWLPVRGTSVWDTRLNLTEMLERVLRLPAVAAKHFLITIGDRTVGGLTARDQMVGPWQVPVADCAVTLTDFSGFSGEAMALGERAPVAMLNAPAAGRLAVGEVITNLAGADIAGTEQIRLSANWMAAAGVPGQDAALFETVQAVGMELCPALGISIPVGKDSLSMRTLWTDAAGQSQAMIAPVSLIVSGFAPVTDARRSLTPYLDVAAGGRLWLFDLGEGAMRLGGSALLQTQKRVGRATPDVVDVARLRDFFTLMQDLKAQGLVLAYHDRSDGGVIVTLLEMAFASRCGLDIMLPAGVAAVPWLFNEELGAVVQVPAAQEAAFSQLLEAQGWQDRVQPVASLQPSDPAAMIRVRQDGQLLLEGERAVWQGLWQETSAQMQRLRDEPACADEAFQAVTRASALHYSLSFDPGQDVAAPWIQRGVRPRVAILREQGVNGQLEMAAAFARAGFSAVDVHMSDLLAGRQDLATFKGLAACGGFSFGDVLGAGGGWAKGILYHAAVREQFAAFFNRPDTFSLGVCNGCQMLAHLAELIPGAEDWPRFVRNRSEQFEARFTQVWIPPNPSLFFRDMVGSSLPVVVAHGEGRAYFTEDSALERLQQRQQVVLQYGPDYGQPALVYPENPNGSPQGVTGFTTRDGRVTLMMPHPERVFRRIQQSWSAPDGVSHDDGAWLRLFRNARVWVD